MPLTLAVCASSWALRAASASITWTQVVLVLTTTGMLRSHAKKHVRSASRTGVHRHAENSPPPPRLARSSAANKRIILHVCTTAFASVTSNAHTPSSRYVLAQALSLPENANKPILSAVLARAQLSSVLRGIQTRSLLLIILANNCALHSPNKCTNMPRQKSRYTQSNR